MILEEETYERFGYYPSDLSHCSGKTIMVKCEDCGKIREVKVYNYSAFCVSCARKGERNATWKPKVERICEYCGKPFVLLHCQIKVGKGTYCSNQCKYKAMEGKYKGEKSPVWIPRTLKICKYCGMEFEINPFQANKVFCSVSCLGKFHTGKNHPNWKDMVLRLSHIVIVLMMASKRKLGTTMGGGALNVGKPKKRTMSVYVFIISISTKIKDAMGKNGD